MDHVTRSAALVAVLWLTIGCRSENAAPPDVPAGSSAAALASAVSEPPAATSAEPAYPIEPAEAAIREALASGRLPGLARPGMPPPDAQLATVYHDGFTPVWVTAAGKPGPAAHDALKALREAGSEGLRPADYASARLDSLAVVLNSAARPDPVLIGRFDATLTTGFIRFAADLHAGRIDPRTLGYLLSLPEDLHDVPSQIAAAVADGRVAETITELRPRLVQYQRLREALARYRGLADSGTEQIPSITASIKPGARWVGLAAVSRRLVLLGDLPAGTRVPADSVSYHGQLVEAVKRFQDRHGLEPDGVIGKGTVAALTVPMVRRVHQLELGLERLRWLPDLSGGRFIIVNIPTFQLWAWDSLNSAGVPSLAMNVVVGNSLDTRTPVLQEEMRYLVFRPYWNVPRSITVKEVLPKLRGNPAYLGSNDMEIVSGRGEDAAPVAATPANLERLAKGQLRVRQRPGPRNSLGLVKFIFPNDEAVYLHSTPAQELFSRTRRDFSHGCVRVEKPVDLAEWVLRNRPEWTRERIVQAMQQGKPLTVTLPIPLPVILFYTTAITSPEGSVRFFEDIYGHDARLLRALEEQ